MRNLKKVLALVVAFSMMLSVVAFAGYKDVPADAEFLVADCQKSLTDSFASSYHIVDMPTILGTN